MKIYYDDFQRPEPAKIYLGTPYHKILCVLNGIDEESVSLKENLNNAYELSFDVDRFIIDEDGNQVESNGYNWIQHLMRLYVDNIGWFICSPPSISNDGVKEVKTVTATSCEIEMVQHDIKNLKINRGTTDSYEMLIEGNVTKDETGVEHANNHVVFCNKENPELSLLHILLKVTGVHGWTIGYIDDIPKEYKNFKNGELVTVYKTLSEEEGSFEVEAQDLYSFITQDMAQYFGCVFIFDIKNLTINAYRPENIGKNTNINIGFRNLQNSNDITIDENNIFTSYTVTGSDALGITYVNGGTNYIENIEYFLNEKYLSKDTIEKYKLWQQDLEINRPRYIEQTRLYNAQLDVITELKNRLPLDDCSTDWSTFPDEKLIEAQANYQAQLKGYEEFYVDDNGDFDEEALKASSDANDYYQIKDVILPSIQIEMENRLLDPGIDSTEYIDSYKTNWKLYGLDELAVKLKEYENIIEVAKKGKYDTPYTEESGHTEDYHNAVYNKYLDALNQLDEKFEGSCKQAYINREAEVSANEFILEQRDFERQKYAKSMDKTTWQHIDYDTKQVFSFLDEELAELSKLYVDNTYTNENMFLVSSDTAVTAIDEQLKLLEAAKDDLSAASQPQFTYATSLDNFLAQYEYKDYTNNLNLGDFVWLGVRDDYVVKLRIISISYNPLLMDNNLQIEFSNMIRSRAKRDDFTYLLGGTTGRGKTSSTGSGGDYVQNEGIGLTSGLINKLLANGSFKNTVNQWIEDGMAINGNNIIAGSGGEISIEQLNSKMIKVVDIIGENAFFEYLQSKLISTDKIVADSGVFDELEALVAKIDSLIAGTVSAEDFHALRLTVDNAVIDDAVIKDLIAAKITVGMLAAGEIDTNKFNVSSQDGGLTIVGNTMQFSDKDGNVRIQIGRDNNDEFTFTLYNSDGTGVLIDDTGIHESAITDGLIKNEMIAEGTIAKDRLGFPIVETDNNGKVSITEILDGNGKPLGVSITQFETSIEELGDKISDTTSEVTKVTESVTQLSSTVDKNTKAITDKVWSSDIATEINNYDQSTVKTIKDTVAEHTVSIGSITSKVSSVESTFGDNVRQLNEKISEVEQDADSFKVTVSNTYATQSNVNDLSDAFMAELKGLQDQLDGAIESWFYDPVPTLENEPAINWTTKELKDIHLGDLYYAGNGRCYRFQLSNSIYSWQEIQDTEVSQAIAKAAEAQRLANEKCKVFVVTPIPPYKVGDLWLKDGHLYRCNHDNTAGAFSESEWELATDYQTSAQVQASIKVESDRITLDVTEKIDDLSVSSRNLLRNSKTLIFDSYGLLSNGI